MLKLSIIIPVYNVEKYVEKCIRSCAEQDLPPEEYEIIIINDGTKDRSLEIAERVVKDYTNITIYSQENAGLSAARNKGLSMANGEYVWFIDSDDWIERSSLKRVVESAQGNDALSIGYTLAFDDISKNENVIYINYNGSRVRNKKAFLLKNFRTQAPFYIYRKEFLIENNLTFLPGIFHEDAEFIPRMLYHAKQVDILNIPVYFVYKRPGSITTTPNPKRAFDYIVVAESLGDFSNKIDKKYQSFFNGRISLCINNALFLTGEMEQGSKDKFISCVVSRKYLFRHLMQSDTLKYKIEGVLFWIWPRHIIFIYNLLQKFNYNTFHFQ